MVEITPTVTVTDFCVTQTGVTYYVATPPNMATGGSNQPVNGQGDGNTEIDWNVNGDYIEVRAERAGGRVGDNTTRDRIYTIAAEIFLSNGDSAVLADIVTVPHDQR